MNRQSETLAPDLNVVRVQHQPTVRMPGPDLNEVRVQRLASVGNVNANPSEVRVQPNSLFLCALCASAVDLVWKQSPKSFPYASKVFPYVSICFHGREKD